MKQWFKNSLEMAKTKRSKQVIALYSSMIMAAVLGLCISMVNTRILNKDGYGDLKFLEFLFKFTATIATMGFFMSGGRLLAKKEHDGIQNQLTGGIFFIAAIISTVLIVGIFIFSSFQGSLFGNELGRTIRSFSLLLFVFPMKLCLGATLPGKNQIFKLSLFRVLPPAIFLAAIFLYSLCAQPSLHEVFFLRYGAIALVAIIILYTLKPKLNNIRKSLQIIWQENINYGLHIHIGVISSTATAHLGGLLVAYFVDNISVGYFGLALTTTMPLTLMPVIVGTTFFKQFANIDKIPKSVFVITTAITVTTLLGYLLIIDKVIMFFYPAEFAPAIPLARILATGRTLEGLGVFITHFLRAHGKGKELRNSAILVGIVNIIGYSLLIYRYKTLGVVITRLIMGVVFFSAMVFHYVKTTRKNIIHKIHETEN